MRETMLTALSASGSGANLIGDGDVVIFNTRRADFVVLDGDDSIKR